MATTILRPAALGARTLAHHPAKQRLLELENEHRQEDAEALKFTDVRLSICVLCHSTR
jgi:hypothetical protein